MAVTLLCYLYQNWVGDHDSSTQSLDSSNYTICQQSQIWSNSQATSRLHQRHIHYSQISMFSESIVVVSLAHCVFTKFQILNKDVFEDVINFTTRFYVTLIPQWLLDRCINHISCCCIIMLPLSELCGRFYDSFIQIVFREVFHDCKSNSRASLRHCQLHVCCCSIRLPSQL